LRLYTFLVRMDWWYRI